MAVRPVPRPEADRAAARLIDRVSALAPPHRPAHQPEAGEYAPGAGSLFIIADIDMIASTTACGAPVCGGSYDPLNNNGIYALNTFSFLQSQGGTPPIPEPETYALMLAGLGLMGWMVRRRQR